MPRSQKSSSRETVTQKTNPQKPATNPDSKGSTRQRLLNFLHEGQGRPATVRELAQKLGLSSPASVHRHLKKLAEEGLTIQVPGGGSRSWAPLSQHPNQLDPASSIPIVGRIAAGIPIESCLDSGAHPEEWLDMAPTAFGQKQDVVALIVEGESMRDAGIHSGDHAVIRRQPSVENGEIAAVTIEGEGTLKRWRKKDGREKRSQVFLEASHPDFPPLELREGMGEIQIFGKLIGVVRKFPRSESR